MQSKFSDTAFYAKPENITVANKQIKAFDDEIKELQTMKGDMEHEYLMNDEL